MPFRLLYFTSWDINPWCSICFPKKPTLMTGPTLFIFFLNIFHFFLAALLWLGNLLRLFLISVLNAILGAEWSLIFFWFWYELSPTFIIVLYLTSDHDIRGLCIFNLMYWLKFRPSFRNQESMAQFRMMDLKSFGSLLVLRLYKAGGVWDERSERTENMHTY